MVERGHLEISVTPVDLPGGASSRAPAGGLPGDPAHGGAIPRLDFDPPRERVPGFEIIDLATLHRRRRRPGGRPDAVHRVGFHTLTLITRGSGEHTVDFVTHPCRPGTLLWIRPGQVQRFTDPGTTDGTHLLFTPSFPPRPGGAGRLMNDWYGTVCRQLGAGPEYTALSTLLGQLRAEYDRPEGTVSPEILQLLLATVLLRIDRLPHSDDGAAPGAGGEVYARFRAELERSYAGTRRAADYAHRLGYTVKTLTRACTAATGQPVKHVIDGRVALEARRLLAHTDEPVATIARRLGFPEPTNFGKFFTRQVGTTPGAFRDSRHVAGETAGSHRTAGSRRE
ncbi:AraC family transcriptional regulator [Streptomyces griseiscabiei]|uniref:Helix-turn-helix transcriptional regulator n=1 Tax=Streptomyces griseiscabiei TaxID=2993540 RepID=A0ABU4L6T7_9ACTN|nr:helix-turn-helix transcriptional regulator [Streptomyces griseiscabiei]MBZ3902035.1 helix-turn-helix domain-containing protein [Streptomyces griseiscabiei]MDX2910763.1 helix-turn-helix transcriptional regulator [Streptomyces griseiscabiei]